MPGHVHRSTLGHGLAGTPQPLVRREDDGRLTYRPCWSGILIRFRFSRVPDCTSIGSGDAARIDEGAHRAATLASALASEVTFEEAALSFPRSQVGVIVLNG